jgi:hypothetical protein
MPGFWQCPDPLRPGAALRSIGASKPVSLRLWPLKLRDVEKFFPAPTPSSRSFAKCTPEPAPAIHHAPDENLDLPEPRDNLLGLVSLPCHFDSSFGSKSHTSGRITFQGADHF